MSKTNFAEVNQEALLKIFTIPEAPDSTLGKIERHLSENLMGFLGEHIVAREKPLQEIEQNFQDSSVPEQPVYVSDHTEFLLEKLVAHSVHTASPRFIGHMTSALPYFLLPLAKLMVGLNQNLVKIETSKAFTPLERNVLGMFTTWCMARKKRFTNAGCTVLSIHWAQCAPVVQWQILLRYGWRGTGC